MTKRQCQHQTYLRTVLGCCILMLLALSCASPKTYKIYEGPQLSSDRIVYLINKAGPMNLHAVDNMRSPDGKDVYGPSKLELLPGVHTLQVSFRRLHLALDDVLYRTTSRNDVSFEVNTEAGHTYVLTSHHDLQKLEWYPVLIDKAENREALRAGPYPLESLKVGRYTSGP